MIAAVAAPADDWIQSRDWIIRVTASFAEHDGIPHAAEALASSRRRIATVAAEGEPDARHSGFLGFLRDRGGDGGGSHPSHPSHPSAHSRRARRRRSPRRRGFLAADASRDADAVGPRRRARYRGGDGDLRKAEIAEQNARYKKKTRVGVSRRRFPRPASCTRGGAPLRFEFSKTSPGSSGWCSRAC